jgi:hypothetical protein
MKRVLFAVVGDLAKHCWELLAPHAVHVLPILLEHFNPNYVAACNNATWCGKRVFWRHVLYQYDRFAKTGSGQP